MADRTPTVLIVDDEEMVITSVRAVLMLETDYRVEGFTDPTRAVEYLKNGPVDMVVSDYLMPKLNGLQLLKAAKDLQPEATRVLLTGHADKQSAIEAINEVSLYHYLEKPWENAALLLVVRNGVERAQLLRELRDSQTSLRDIRARLVKAFL
jgi:DNA-binding NtrC family response regulator